MTQTPETLRHHQSFWWAGVIDWQANPPMGKPDTESHLRDLHDGGEKGFLHAVLSPPHTPLPKCTQF